MGKTIEKANGKQQKEKGKIILGKIVEGVFIFNETFPKGFSIALIAFFFAVCFLLFISPAHTEI
jgi:hypothetical protein